MSYTHDSIGRLRQSMMKQYTHLVNGIRSGENGIY